MAAHEDVELSDGGGWSFSGAVPFDVSGAVPFDGASLDGFGGALSCPLSASRLGGAAAALLAGSDAGGGSVSHTLDGVSSSSGGGGGGAGGLGVPMRSPGSSSIARPGIGVLRVETPPRHGSFGGGGDDLSDESSTSSVSENKTLSPLSPVGSRRQGGAGAQAAHQPPSLLKQWAYRKSLLIQMELCESSTLRDFLEQRDRAVAAARSSSRGSSGSSVGDGGVGGSGMGGGVGGGGGGGGGGVGGMSNDADEDGVSVTRSMEVLVQICQGLEHVHSRGIVHRDLKV